MTSETYQDALTSALQALSTAIEEGEALKDYYPHNEVIGPALPHLRALQQQLRAIRNASCSGLLPLLCLPQLQDCQVSRIGDCILVVAQNPDTFVRVERSMDALNRVAKMLNPLFYLQLVDRDQGRLYEPCSILQFDYRGYQIKVTRDQEYRHLWQADIYSGDGTPHPAARGCPNQRVARMVAKNWVDQWQINRSKGEQ